jgi:DNA-directed RNA polymerase II subunit RPB11
MVKEDHTMGASIKSVLLRDQRVIFAGYRMPHPLEHICKVQIMTTDEIDPLQVTVDALEDLGTQTSALLNQLVAHENSM